MKISQSPIGHFQKCTKNVNFFILLYLGHQNGLILASLGVVEFDPHPTGSFMGRGNDFLGGRYVIRF